jgi:pilus assembly protein CpaB
MGQRFVRYHPALRKTDRERMMFVFAALVTVTLLCAMILVLNNRSEASLPKSPPQLPVEPVRPAIGTVTLFAPDANIPAGTKLSNIVLKEVFWPRNQVPEGAIRDIAEVKALYAKTSLPSGFPLLRSNLTSQPSEGPLPVRPGHRAISIEVDATSGVEGFALPGTRVDVLLTFIKDQIKTTKIIVQNARVLSYGGASQIEELSANAANKLPFQRRVASSTITLEVPPGDALKIQNSRSIGRLGLMLRPLEDSGATDVLSIDENGIYGDKNVKTAKDENRCSKGSVRIGGREYSVGCDGNITQVIDPNEP